MLYVPSHSPTCSFPRVRQTLVMAAVGMLATIDSLLSERRSADPDTNKMLQERFMTPDLAAKVAAKVVGGPGFTGVFTRTGCLQLMRHLLVYGRRSVKAEDGTTETSAH